MTRDGRARLYRASELKTPASETSAPATASLFRKLEQMEQQRASAGATGHGRWMIPYADLLTLLLGLFLVLLTAAKPHPTPVPSAPPPAVVKAVTVPDPARKSAAQSLARRLQHTLRLPGVQIRQQERGLVISLKDSILFAPGRADLSPAARRTLDQLTGQLHEALGGDARPIRVEGHTDRTPITTAQYPSNWELSTARATNIVRYLVATRRFSPARLSAAGYGEFKPVADNSSIEGKQKNRRVDIVVMNDQSAQQEPPGLPHLRSGTGQTR